MLNCHSEHVSEAHFAPLKTTVGGLKIRSYRPEYTRYRLCAFMMLPSCLLILKIFVFYLFE